MNTRQAEYLTALERIERKMAERDAEAAKRQTQLVLAVVVVVGVGIAVMGYLSNL